MLRLLLHTGLHARLHAGLHTGLAVVHRLLLTERVVRVSFSPGRVSSGPSRDVPAGPDRAYPEEAAGRPAALPETAPLRSGTSAVRPPLRQAAVRCKTPAAGTGAAAGTAPSLPARPRRQSACSRHPFVVFIGDGERKLAESGDVGISAARRSSREAAEMRTSPLRR